MLTDKTMDQIARVNQKVSDRKEARYKQIDGDKQGGQAGGTSRRTMAIRM